MVGKKPSIFWQVTWRFISPLIVLVILVFYLVTQAQQKLTYLVWDPDSVSNRTDNSLKHIRSCFTWCWAGLVCQSKSNETSAFCLTGEVPVPGLSALPYMDLHHRVYFSRNPQSDDTSVCNLSANFGYMQEENLTGNWEWTESTDLNPHISKWNKHEFVIKRQQGCAYLLYNLNDAVMLRSMFLNTLHISNTMINVYKWVYQKTCERMQQANWMTKQLFHCTKGIGAPLRNDRDILHHTRNN